MLCHKKIAAALLCSGLGRRMGSGNKLLLDFDGKSLYRHIGEKIASYPELLKYVVTCYDEIAEWGTKNGFILLDNKNHTEGIAASIRLAVRQAERDGADGLLFCNADQPLLSSAAIERIINEFAVTDKIIVPHCKGVPGSPCLFPKRFFVELGGLTGDKGGRKIYSKQLAAVQFVDFADSAEFMDIDTNDDLVNLINYRL